MPSKIRQENCVNVLDKIEIGADIGSCACSCLSAQRLLKSEQIAF
jgi:hypothetical protein